jgi:PERQ amino acid-rich with GYF domain-containing protein
MLLALPSDVEILTEAVHETTKTLDSRHFVEEFVRRKKQAEKGVVEPAGTASPVGNKASENAWSNVAKKGGVQGQQSQQQQQQQPVEAAFKIAKTKGRRK